MIVDCHSHIWPSSRKLANARNLSCLGAGAMLSARPEQHFEASNPAEVVFVLGFVSDYLDVAIPNIFISDYVAAHPEHLIGFAGIDPVRENVLEEIRRLREEEQFAGLVLSPACQNFHPCDSRVMGIYELAEELGMPIFFINSEKLPKYAILQYANTLALDEVARAFPNLKIIITHLGFPWVEQTISLLAKHPNVFADVAGLSNKPWQAYRSLTLAYEYEVIDKLLFASDFPCSTVKTAVEALYNLNKITLDSVLPAVPREQLRGIVERNSLELLGLTLPSGTAQVKAREPEANGQAARISEMAGREDETEAKSSTTSASTKGDN